MDIVLSDSFQYQWNLKDDGGLWILKPNSVNQIGCIHTCQGLELEYIGVIIGPDLLVRNGKVQTYPEHRSKHDRTIRGWVSLSKTNPNEIQKELDIIIKNTYWTLMPRGMKGCMIYSQDRETREYFRSLVEGN